MRVPLRVVVGRCLLVLAACLSAALMFPSVSERTWLGWFYGPIVGLSGIIASVMSLAYWRCSPRLASRPDRAKILSIFGGWMALLLLCSSADAQTFQRSPELQAALTQAALQVQPCNGLTVIDWMGNSDGEREMNSPGGLYEQLWNTTYKNVRRTDLRINRDAISGKTSSELVNPNDTEWLALDQKMAALGAQPCASQWLMILLTQQKSENPSYGPLTVERVNTVLSNYLATGRQPKGITIFSMNPTGCENCLMSISAGNGQDALFTQYAGIHFGLPVDYIQQWRIPGWTPSMWDADLVHQNVNLGNPYLATWAMQQLRESGFYCWMFTDQPCATTPPPPPADPVYGELVRKWYNGKCYGELDGLEAEIATPLCGGLY